MDKQKQKVTLHMSQKDMERLFEIRYKTNHQWSYSKVVAYALAVTEAATTRKRPELHEGVVER